MGTARTLQTEQGTLVRVQAQAQSSGSGRSPDPTGPHGSVKHRAYALLLRYRQRGGGGASRRTSSPSLVRAKPRRRHTTPAGNASSLRRRRKHVWQRRLHIHPHGLSTYATHTSARRASHASACASQGTRAVPLDITGQDTWTGYPCQSRAASTDCRPAPDAPECKGGSETAVPEGTTEYTRPCASGKPRRTRDQLNGCAPPAAPHAHTWSMRAPRTYQPHRLPQNDGDPSHHAPPPPSAPRPCEMMGEGEPEHVSRLLFGAEHGRASTEIT